MVTLSTSVFFHADVGDILLFYICWNRMARTGKATKSIAPTLYGLNSDPILLEVLVTDRSIHSLLCSMYYEWFLKAAEPWGNPVKMLIKSSLL